MKLDKFINRPVLSTVISVLMVILGVIGLVTYLLHNIRTLRHLLYQCALLILELTHKLC